MSNAALVLESLGRLEAAGMESARPVARRFSRQAAREWAGICLWAVFCLACGCAGMLAAFIR